MTIVRHGLLLLLLQLIGCASYPPIQYPDVVSPQAVVIEPVRRAERPVVALVLGSGGDRGFAHVGVVKVLEESGIPIDVVAGSSVGSVVGALYAGGYGGTELERLAFELDQRQFNDFDLSKRGYVRGEQLQDFINRALENRSIEQLDKPFAVVATRLDNGEVAVFNRGNTGLAVRASSSIPGVFHPAVIGDTEYVDGDLKQPVPVNVVRAMGAELVIAVDISPRPADYPQPQDIIDMLNQSLRIMRLSIAAHELKKAQVVIRPAIGQTPDIDEAAKRQLIQSGEEAARTALPQIREWLNRLTAEKSSKRPGK